MAYNGPLPQKVIAGGTGAATLTGVLIGNGTSAVTGNAVTQYDTLIGGASNAISSVAPSATSGVPLISQGSSANPTYGTAVVAGGGTGVASATAYAILAGGTSTTGNFQSLATGSSGQVLTSKGSSTLPAYVASNTVGSLVFIQSQAAGASASISFTTGITSTYTTYLFVLSNVVAATNGATITMTVSVNGGSSYLSSSYTSGLMYFTYNSGSWNNLNSTSSFYLMAGTNGNSGSGAFKCFNITTATPPVIAGQTWANNAVQVIGGAQATTGGVNAFQFIATSGNITSGTFTLFGVLE